MRVLNVETAVVETGSTADLSVGETKIAFMLSGAKPAPIPKPAVAPRTTPAQTTAPSSALVRVEGGTFQMGSNDGDGNEEPVHTVTVKSFYMGKYEVTQKEWTAVMGGNPSNFKGNNLPVECVSWYDAIEYCNRLSVKEKLTPAYTINGTNVTWNRNANGYRLPTEAEWEYAARGGNGSPGNYTFAGSNNVDEVAWYDENSARSTQEAGAKKPNGLGLYDMSGNVWEWCWDWYGDYASGAQTDPTGASSGSILVPRGGGLSSPAQYVRSASRGNGSPSLRSGALGFHIVRNG
jgi:formylglycine-generating enzyme required for sulfatase activity